MDVVWMAELFTVRVLKNNLGQSAVEYIMLLALISSIVFAFYHNNKFQEFIKGKEGLFATLRKGMGYSYRYGLEYRPANDNYEMKMQFKYGSKEHDTYYNASEGKSHFFSGTEDYPKN